jgi:hypothetical protein
MAARRPNRNNLKSLFNGEVLRNVFSDRTRTNLLKKQEEMAISWLVQRIPSFITSNMLTGIGFFGNMSRMCKLHPGLVLQQELPPARTDRVCNKLVR